MGARRKTAPEDLAVGGYLPLTTVDFPGRLAAVVFLQGCPWRCPYCHNPELQSFAAPCAQRWPNIRDKLAKRAGLLDGVVFSGGEPTAQPPLPDAMREVREMGFEVGLHTAGIFPERLEKVLPFTDWVGLDIKAPPDARYDRITRQNGSADLFLKSLEAIRKSGTPFTLRTTVAPEISPPQEIEEMQSWLRDKGLPESQIQVANPRGTKIGAPGASRTCRRLRGKSDWLLEVRRTNPANRAISPTGF